MLKNDENNERDYYFKGTWISRREANRIGFASIFGLASAVFLAAYFPTKDEPTIFLISLVVTGIGYFIIAPKIFPDKTKR